MLESTFIYRVSISRAADSTLCVQVAKLRLQTAALLLATRAAVLYFGFEKVTRGVAKGLKV